MQRAFQFNQKKQGSGKNAQRCKKILLTDKFMKHWLSAYEAKATRSNGTVFADRNAQVKNTKFKKERIESVDCLLDGYGNCTSKLVTSKIKPFGTSH